MKRTILTTFITISMFSLFGQNMPEKEFNKISEKIYPVIKVQIVQNESDSVFKMSGENEPVFRKIAGDLLCFYGIDRETHFELLLKKNLPATISQEKLDSISQENLLKEIENNLKVHQTDIGGYEFTCGGEFEAALLTLPGIWELIVERLGKSIVFNVPSKDLIMFVSSENLNGIEGLKKVNNEIYKGGERLLSNQLFRYENGKIELFEKN
jgi:uncharacterized protein YtpQ (UPF0354 family)